MRKILVVTSGRADASPLKPVVSALRRKEILVYELNLAGGYSAADSIHYRNFDAMLLLGDRYETLAAALMGTVARIPIAHIHGGEASFGSFDNQIRDAITKLAHIHFVAARPMRQRLLDIGEDDWRIHVVGAPGLENIYEALSIPSCRSKTFVVTYHPATLGDAYGVHELLKALTRFHGYSVLWTGVNNDPLSDEIARAFSAAGHRDARFTLPEYLRAVRRCSVVVGNSSSGIIEAPSLGVPTVNVGQRQNGRLKGPSIFDCEETADEIEAAIYGALAYSGPFDNPYKKPGTSERIAAILATVDLKDVMVKRWC